MKHQQVVVFYSPHTHLSFKISIVTHRELKIFVQVASQGVNLIMSLICMDNCLFAKYVALKEYFYNN